MLYRLFFSDGAGHPLTLERIQGGRGRSGRRQRLARHVDAVHQRAAAATSRPRTRAGRGAASAPGSCTSTRCDFARQLTTFRTRPGPARRRGRTLRRAVRGGALGGLRRTGAGRAVSEGLETTVVPFTAGDGLQLQPASTSAGDSAPTQGRRCCSSTGPACGPTSSARRRSATWSTVLVDSGYDVWLENWRASIDIPHNHWTLDQAAVLRSPGSGEDRAERTGAEEVQAVIHCQGSTSFMMSAVAGLVPEVTTIVSNAVSLHPVVSRLARLKMDWVLPPAAKVLGYLNPQWGVKGAPWILPKAITAWVKLDPPRVRQRRLQARPATPTALASRRSGATRT